MRGIAETVGETGGRRFIEDAHDLQTCQLSGLTRSVALGVRKIGRHGNDRLCDRLIHIALSPFHQLAKNQGGDLLGCELLVSELHGLGRTHLSLDTPDGQMRIEELLMARLPAHEQRAGRREAHTRWQHLVGLRAKNLYLVIDESCDLRVGGSEIDTYDHITHLFHFLLWRLLWVCALPSLVPGDELPPSTHSPPGTLRAPFLRLLDRSLLHPPRAWTSDRRAAHRRQSSGHRIAPERPPGAPCTSGSLPRAPLGSRRLGGKHHGAPGVEPSNWTAGNPPSSPGSRGPDRGRRPGGRADREVHPAFPGEHLLGPHAAFQEAAALASRSERVTR